MRGLLLSVLLVPLAFGIAYGQDRNAAPHVHGEGTLQLVQTGAEAALSLKVSAADIVGFEHEAETDTEKAALAEALQALSDPVALFLTGSSCKVLTVSPGSFLDEAEHEHDHEAHEDEHEEHGHADIVVDYVLSCESAIAAIDTTFFDAFPAAHSLKVEAMIEGGAVVREVSRDQPVLSIAQ